MPKMKYDTHCANVIHVPGMGGTSEKMTQHVQMYMSWGSAKKQPWYLGKMSWKNAEFLEHLQDVHN